MVHIVLKFPKQTQLTNLTGITCYYVIEEQIKITLIYLMKTISYQIIQIVLLNVIMLHIEYVERLIT